ncbi:MAG: MerR family transcriptional regulator [Candidatus Avilachnospira sp.]|jgi:DNA-binding transcriptional MerR regulator
MDHSKKRYNIGEVAELLGVSRDTLRIYEEEGLVAPMRGENGYRLYSDEDICGLISIKFHRLNDVPTKEIRNIIDPSSDKADSMGHIRDIILRRIEAEEAELGLSPRPGAPFYSYFTCRHEDRASGGPRYILELCLPVEK